jgi:hypothetical protein
MAVTRLNTDVAMTGSRLEKMRAETIVSIFFHIIIPFCLEAELKNHYIKIKNLEEFNDNVLI